MSNLAEDFWNHVPQEILANVFSFLPIRDRYTVLHVCKKWAAIISSSAVWSFTELSCDFVNEDEAFILEKLQLYLGHIRHLKIILYQSLELNRRLVTRVLDALAWKSSKLEALCIVCQGKSPYFYSGQDVLQSVRGLCHSAEKTDLQYVDFRQMPFTLDNGTVLLLASSSPNLHTLLINNRAPGLIILKPETIVEVLRVCPKISVLGTYYASLSKDLFQELVKPSRGPFKGLDIFFDGLEKLIPEELWAMLSQRHPQFRVKLEFAPTIPTVKILRVLRMSIPIASLQFNSFHHIADQMKLVTSCHSQTLERLILHVAPSDALNSSLMELARTCIHLKEVHCYCVVSQAVIDTFLLYCPGLRSYTLSINIFSTIPPVMSP
ncbi:F-box/LRR-repeat protein 8-like [Candoia aspera]|uniref:F-box/LRR-repeat protein 8-like n=1 Tax=Candoia aspera TaxID=51853 RepID=UPI002FD7B6DC